MTRWRKAGLSGAVVAGLALLVLISCESSSRRTDPDAGAARRPPPSPAEPSRPPEPPRDAQPAEPPGVQPDQPPAVTQDRPPVEPGKLEPQAPPFVTVLEAEKSGERPRVDFRLERGNRLILDLHNVHRFRIDRERTGTDPRRSVYLQLDGQSLEWVARSPVEEFERDTNGFWVPVQPARRK